MSETAFSIIISSAPYSSSHFKEALDLALAASAFDRSTNILLEDDACYVLTNEHDSTQINQKNLVQVMKALPIYGIEEVLVCKSSALNRNLDMHISPIPIKLLDDKQKAEIIRNTETVIRF